MNIIEAMRQVQETGGLFRRKTNKVWYHTLLRLPNVVSLPALAKLKLAGVSEPVAVQAYCTISLDDSGAAWVSYHATDKLIRPAIDMSMSALSNDDWEVVPYVDNEPE